MADTAASSQLGLAPGPATEADHDSPGIVKSPLAVAGPCSFVNLISIFSGPAPPRSITQKNPQHTANGTPMSTCKPTIKQQTAEMAWRMGTSLFRGR
jgi:hypothetical protein